MSKYQAKLPHERLHEEWSRKQDGAKLPIERRERTLFELPAFAISMQSMWQERSNLTLEDREEQRQWAKEHLKHGFTMMELEQHDAQEKPHGFVTEGCLIRCYERGDRMLALMRWAGEAS